MRTLRSRIQRYFPRIGCLGRHTHFRLNFVNDVADQFQVNVCPVRQKSLQKDPVKQGVDAPGNSACVVVDAVEYFWIEGGLFAGTRTFQAMQDVLAGFICLQGAEMASGGDTLTQLQHAGALQDFPKLGLANQKSLQQCVLATLEVGQHAQLFHRLLLKILRFVDDQQATLSLQRLGDEERFQCQQQVTFGDTMHMDAECGPHQSQRVFGTQLRAHQMGGDNGAWVQTFDQAAHNRRLARPHLARNHNESFATHHAVL